MQMGLFTYETSLEFKKELENVLRDNPKREPTEPETGTSEESGLQSQANFNIDKDHGNFVDTCESVIAVLITAVCGYVGLNNELIRKSGLDWKTKLIYTIPSLAGAGYSIKRFLHMIFPILKHIFKWIVEIKAKYVDDVYAGFMMINSSLIGNWIVEVNEITRTGFDHSILDNRDRIYIAYNLGMIFEKRVLHNTTRFNALKSYIQRIREKWNDVVKDGFTPTVRREPWSQWIHGDPGLGKSTLIDTITSTIIRENNIPIPQGEMTCTVNPSSKYLTRVNGQPELRIDDFMAILSPENVATQCGLVFDVITTAPFVPVRAAVEDKDTLYSPAIFTVLCNSALPEGMPLSNREAFARRRNVTVLVKGNYDGLLKEFGEVFKQELAKCKVYGRLPAVMKENYKHLTFTFQDIMNPTFTPRAIMVDGRTTHDFAQFMDIMRVRYAEHVQISTASYTQRLAENYASRGMEVPIFANLLENQEIDIQFALTEYIAKYEGDHKVLEALDVLFDKSKVETSDAHRIWASTRKNATLSAVFNKVYSNVDVKQGTGMDQQGNKDKNVKFMTKSDDVIAGPSTLNSSHVWRTKITLLEYMERYNNNMLQRLNGKLKQYEDDELLVYAKDTILFKEKGILVPLSYKIMEEPICSHCITGKTQVEIDDIMLTPMCVENCCYIPEVIAEVSGHYYFCVRQQSPESFSYYQRVKGWMARTYETTKHWYTKAKEYITRCASWIYGKIKLMGITLRDFFTEHWKVTIGIIMAAVGLMVYMVSVKQEDNYVLRIMPDGTVKTSAGMVVNKSKSAIRSLGHHLGICDQQAYNEKVRSKVIEVRSPSERPAKTPQADISNDQMRVISEAFIPVVCEMNAQWPTELWQTSLFCYGGRKCVMTRHEYEILSGYAKVVHLVMSNKNGENFSIPLKPYSLNWTELDHYANGNNLCRKGNLGTITLPKKCATTKVSNNGFLFLVSR